jgi:cytochrome bd-type quinol oxidase subunit 1
MVTAAYLTTSFVALGVRARFLLAGKHADDGRTMVRMAVGFATIVAPLQLIIGDQHGGRQAARRRGLSLRIVARPEGLRRAGRQVGRAA